MAKVIIVELNISKEENEKRLEKVKEVLEKIIKENDELKEKVKVLTEQLRKISLISIESINILSNLA